MEALVLLVFYAPVMGYLAICKGRSFWLWFTIGLFLPIVSLFILFFLKDKPVVINPENVVLHQHNDKVLYTKEIETA
jgi:hypothetical protein